MREVRYLIWITHRASRRKWQQRSLAAINELNGQRLRATDQPEIASRIRNYELAFRMQSAAPELIDLSDESPATLEAYGVNRVDKTGFQASYARNCLLAPGAWSSAALDL